jgi:hypothetical protein
VRKLFKTGKKIPPSSIQPSLGKKKKIEGEERAHEVVSRPWSGFSFYHFCWFNRLNPQWHP